ncbi:MAG: hypothetical protein ACYCWW_20800 [Deltaproteobacteria bacterium]
MLARPLSRRLDELARRAHAFHRFAHHPLCERYAGELVPLGRRTRVCRGCLLSLLGLGLGLAGALALGLRAALWLVALALATAAPAIRLRQRWPKALTRFAPFAVVGLALGGALSQRCPAWSACAVLSGALLALMAYRRRGPNRRPCVDCPERTLEICSGFRPIARRERAFQRLAGRWLDRAA